MARFFAAVLSVSLLSSVHADQAHASTDYAACARTQTDAIHTGSLVQSKHSHISVSQKHGERGDKDLEKPEGEEASGAQVFEDPEPAGSEEDEDPELGNGMGKQDFAPIGHENLTLIASHVGMIENRMATGLGPTYYLVKKDVECKSSDKGLGSGISLQVCADKVKANGGTYFVYGKGSKHSRCYQEHTTNRYCGEGWESDQYDFYKLAGESSWGLVKDKNLDSSCFLSSFQHPSWKYMLRTHRMPGNDFCEDFHYGNYVSSIETQASPGCVLTLYDAKGCKGASQTAADASSRTKSQSWYGDDLLEIGWDNRIQSYKCNCA